MIKIEEPESFTRITIKEVEAFRIHEAGVYFLENQHGEVIYIGKTGNFRRRLREHLRGRGNSAAFSNHISTVRLYEIKDEYQREMYETFLINKYKPYYNIGKVFDNDKGNAAFNEYHKIQAELTDVQEQRREAREYFRLREDRDFISEYEETYGDDAKVYELGSDLWHVNRLRELDSEYARLKGKLSTVRAQIF